MSAEAHTHDNHAHDDHATHEGGHGTLTSYLIGFGLSVILTAIILCAAALQVALTNRSAQR